MPKDHQSHFGAIPECPQPPQGMIPEGNRLEELLWSGCSTLTNHVDSKIKLNQAKVYSS